MVFDLDPIALINTFGYLGVFLTSLISNATVIFPIPGFFVIPVASTVLNPFLVAVVGGLGAAIGELVGYGIGAGGRRLYQKRKPGLLERLNPFAKKKGISAWSDKLTKLFHRYTGFLIIIIFSATPLPHDVMGLFCGAIRYDVKKFFLATFIGRTLLFLGLAFGASIGIDIFVDFYNVTNTTI